MSEIIVACRSFISVDLHKTTVTLVTVNPSSPAEAIHLVDLVAAYWNWDN